MDAQGSPIQPGKRLTNAIRKYFCLILICCAHLPGAAVPDSLVYRFQPKNQDYNLSFNGVNFSFVFNDDNSDHWFYKAGDDYRYALKGFDDSGWKLTGSDFDIDETDSTFNGIAWLRLHFRTAPEFAGKTFMVRITHNGASEIFVDGKLLVSYGVVSADPAREIGRDPHNVYFPLCTTDTLEHVMAVRYSNAGYQRYFTDYEVEEVGFTMRFFHTDDMADLNAISEYQRFIFIGISMFLFALALVHFMIYMFEPSRKFNLYHSIFVFCLSLLFLLPVINRVVESPLTSMRMNHYSDVLIPVFFFSVITLLYSLFQKKLNKFYYIALGCFVLALITKYVFNSWYGLFYTSLFFMMYIGSIIISIKAIRRNFRGARIVGVGVLSVTLFMILAISSLAVLKEDGLIVAIVAVLLSVLSIPISMSIYLAYDFAGANKTLQQQIVQIEDLSEKALRDEKEKKEILENQNRVLEEQVKERTAEIREQKEIIEEKNKDITDSINYAKRIQEAILASKEIKYRIFPNAFVLFKPKDIVSGDFYWFAGKGDRRLIAACDCTGHGVPGALMSMIGNNLLNQIVNERGIVSAADVLENLHTEVRKTLKQDENNHTRDGMDVALLSFMSDTEFEYAGAQRPLWLVRKGELLETKGTKISVGGQRFDDSLSFVNHHVKAGPGDHVYIFSDGYADQFNREDKKLMTRKFKEVLLSIQHLDMPGQEKYLSDFIENWKGDMEQTDDILVIGIRI